MRTHYRRSLRIGLGVSAVVHLLALALYPSFSEREGVAPIPFFIPSAGAPTEGMRVIEVITIDESVERPDAPEEVIEVEQPAAEVQAPAVDEAPGTVLVEPGPTVAERLQPFIRDPRLFAPLDEALNALTLEQILELDLEGRIVEWQDSLAERIGAERALTDWTYTDEEGKRWGVADGRLHLGDFSIPFPMAFGTPVGKRDEVARRAWEWEEIQRGAQTAATRASWKERSAAIRARRDAERARARADTSGVRR